MGRYLVIVVIVCVVSLNTHFAHAKSTILVSDGSGQPIADAVLSFPKRAIEQVDSANLAIMDQVDMMFHPHVLVIQKNQKVIFPNSDDIRHHVYSFSEPKTFELKLYRGRETSPIQMDTAGFVELGCNIHDDMLGYIYISDGEYAIKTNKDGIVTLPSGFFDESPAPSHINIWHSLLNTQSRKQSLPFLKGPDGIYHLTLDIRANDTIKSDRGFTPKF